MCQINLVFFFFCEKKKYQWLNVCAYACSSAQNRISENIFKPLLYTIESPRICIPPLEYEGAECNKTCIIEKRIFRYEQTHNVLSSSFQCVALILSSGKCNEYRRVHSISFS